MTEAANALVAGFAVAEVGTGEHSAEVLEQWRLFVGPNGGWALGTATELAGTLDDRPLRSLSLHYLSPPANGPISLHHRELRAGRSTRSFSIEMVQDDKIRCAGIATVGAPRGGPTYDDLVAPELPAADALIAEEPPLDAHVPPFTQLWDYRRAIGHDDTELEGASIAERAGAGQVGGWIRPRASIPVGPPQLAAMCDAWYPPYFRRVGGDPMTSGVPTTVDLTAHLLEPLPQAAPGDWWMVRSTTHTMRGGYCDIDTEVWHQSGVLVARAHQLLALIHLS